MVLVRWAQKTAAFVAGLAGFLRAQVFLGPQEVNLISSETEAQILRLHHAERWPTGTIASQLDVHHDAVERVLSEEGLPKTPAQRPSIADVYVPFISQTLQKYPTLTATRLWSMARERGYPGRSLPHFRQIVSRFRPRAPAEAYLRLQTLPGVEAQVDWAHFGKTFVGKAQRLLMAFVMVLSWSRAIFLRFFYGQQLSNFLRGHESAFEAFGGVPRTVLLDNLKSAVLQRVGDAIRFHPTYLDFSGHWRFEARPVAVARGNEKGRVERAIQYVRTSFFPARSWRDLDDLNRQAQEWTQGEAMARAWREDPQRTVRDAFQEERGKLLPLAEEGYPTDERVEVSVGKCPYVRFDLNDYSVPHSHVKRTLVVFADLARVRILQGTEVIAEHARSWDKGRQIENPAHVEALVRWKSRARKGRGTARLSEAAPSATALLGEMALRGQNIATAVSMLLRLLETYGAEELEGALKEALARGVPHPHAVRQALERRREERGKPAALPLDLPEDPRVRGLVVKPHSLSTYDQLTEESTDGKNNSESTLNVQPV